VPISNERDELVALLSRAGFVAAQEEAADLLAYANGDTVRLGSSIERRLRASPSRGSPDMSASAAWISESTLGSLFRVGGASS